MRKINIYKAALIASLVVPSIAFGAFDSVKGLIKDIDGLIQDLVIVVIGLAMLFFFWNMGQVILKSGDPKAREESRNRMVWGVIAIFVMFSIWGIVYWIGDNLGIEVGGNGSDSGVSPLPSTPVPPLAPPVGP